MPSSNPYVLLTNLLVEPDETSVVIDALKEQPSRAAVERTYRGSSPGELLMLSLFPTYDALTRNALSRAEARRERRVAASLRSDWRRQALELVSIAHATEIALWESKALQIRHIEVPRRMHAEYAAWRRDTIFAHVRQQPLIESFHAYHTVLSAKPGVVFLAGFSCPTADYLASFTVPAYLDIIRQAGDRYIAGGKEGLSTAVYQQI